MKDIDIWPHTSWFMQRYLWNKFKKGRKAPSFPFKRKVGLKSLITTDITHSAVTANVHNTRKFLAKITTAFREIVPQLYKFWLSVESSTYEQNPIIVDFSNAFEEERWFGLVWFYGISTFIGYLTPNPFLCK